MHRRTNRTWRASAAGIAIAAVSLVTFALPTGAAVAAESADDEVTTQGTAHTFQVLNLTRHTMVSGGASAYYPNQEARFDNNKPASAGEKFIPGFEDDFSMTHWFLYENASYLTYHMNGGWGSVTVEARVEGFWGTPSLKCVTAVGPVRCDIEGQRAVIRSTSATSTVIESNQQQAQADALNGLCESGSPHVSCAFEPKGQLVETKGESTLLGKTKDYNCKVSTGYRAQFSFGVEETSTVSVGGHVQLGGSIANSVQLSVQQNFNETWTWYKMSQESHATDIAPGFWGWVTHQGARLRTVGDFVAKIGNDTILIKDVSFEAPNQRLGAKGVLGSHERIMEVAERIEHCKETPEVAERRYADALARNGG